MWNICIIFAIVLINKDLMVKSENFFKTNYDLLHTDIDVLASLYFNGKRLYYVSTELYDALILSSGGMTKVLKNFQDRGLIKREVNKW